MSSTLQVTRQIQYLLAKATWPDGSKLFRNVWETPLDVLGVLEYKQVPFCTVVPTAMTVSPHFQDEFNQFFEITTVVHVGGDKTGRSDLIGKDRGDGAQGRGILEFEDVFFSTLDLLTETQGIKFSFRGAGAGKTQMTGQDSRVTVRTYQFVCRCTQQPTYLKPSHFRLSEAAGIVALNWTNKDIYNLNTIKILRKSGSFSTDEDDGTVVFPESPGTLGEVAANVPGSGTWYYTIFNGYITSGTVGSKASQVYSEPLGRKITV